MLVAVGVAVGDLVVAGLTVGLTVGETVGLDVTYGSDAVAVAVAQSEVSRVQ